MPDNLNTVYLGTPGRGVDEFQGSVASTVLSDVSVTGTSDLNIVQAVGAVQMDSTLAVTGAATFSSTIGTDSNISGANIKGTSGEFTSLITSTAATPLSLATQADFNDMTAGQVRLVFAASGMSIAVSSGTSLYDIGSATSAAQPTS